MRRGSRPAAESALLLAALLLAGCGYDDTPNAMRVIDGETDRVLYGRTVIEAADAVAAGAPPDAGAIAAVEHAYGMSQQAYVAILQCEDDGVCRRSSLSAVCADVERLVAARRVLAPHSDLLAVYESLASGLPFDADRLRAAVAKAQSDGDISPFEQDLLLLAGAGAAFQALREATPTGLQEAERHRGQRAIDAFRQRCGAD
jgi:hypothetical protein